MLSPLGRYIQKSEEKNTNLIAKRHFGLSALDGLVELPLESVRGGAGSHWVLREKQIAICLMQSNEMGIKVGRYSIANEQG